MTRFGIILVTSLAAAVGLGSFFATLGQQRTTQGSMAAPLQRWLGLSEERARLVREADATFPDEAAELSEKLDAARHRLAELLEDPGASDDQIMVQVERVITAHDALERRVARHVLAIRPHLSAEQQKRLMGLCAHGVRRCCGRPWRSGSEVDSAAGEPAEGRHRHRHGGAGPQDF